MKKNKTTIKKLSYLFLFLCANSLILSAQVSLQDKLWAHYSLDWNANDNTLNPANGSVSAAVLTTDRFGRESKAYAFSTGSDRISVSPNSKFGFLSVDSFSYSFWIKPAQVTTTDSYVLNVYQNGGMDVFISGTNSGADSGKVCFIDFDGTVMQEKYRLYTDSALKMNVWQHILVTVDKSDSLTKIYINGRLAGQKSNAVYSFNNAALTIGNHINTNWGLKGAMDDVRLYGRILNQSELNSLVSMSPDTCKFSVYDTVPVNVYDTIPVHDTLLVNVYDSVLVNVYDSVLVNVYDSVLVNVYDSVLVNVYDTIPVYDTIRVSTTDTLIIEVNTTGIGQPNGVINLVKIYPNPASTHIYVDNGSYSQIAAYNITIVNSVGQTVFSSPVNQQTFDIDISSWNAGLYLVNITDQNNVTITRKILINK